MLIHAVKSEGKSVRSLAKRCGIANPNYFQQVLKEERNLTEAVAHKIADGIELSNYQRRYLITLIQLDHCDNANRTRVLKTLDKLRIADSKVNIKDTSRYSSWLYGIVREMTCLDKFELTLDNLVKRIGRLAPRETIESALKFIKRKVWIESTGKGEFYRKTNVRLSPVNDIRNIDVQLIHEKYLELAKLRLKDDIHDREFQGLTIAIPRTKLRDIKESVRKFYDELELELEDMGPADTVIRIQAAVFKVTND